MCIRDSSYGGSTNFEMQFKVEKRATPTWSLEGNAAWAGATPNAFESRSGAIFQHNAGTQFSLGDGMIICVDLLAANYNYA